MPLPRCPEVDNCCHCVTDLRTASAIIAVLAIVTSPIVSWAVIRHSYVIRVSCFITTKSDKPDIIDINLNNVLSFGFGANAGLGPSCFSGDSKQKSSGQDKGKQESKIPDLRKSATAELGPKMMFETEPLSGSGASSQFIIVVKYLGWIVLLADVILLFSSVSFIISLFMDKESKLVQMTKIFMYSAIISITLSFMYGLLYVGTCIYENGSFQVFELIFTFVDLGIWAMWAYFIVVLNSFIHQLEDEIAKELALRNSYYGYIQNYYEYISSLPSYFYGAFWNQLTRILNIFGYIVLCLQKKCINLFISVWVYFLMVINSYRREIPSQEIHPVRPRES